MTYTPLWQQEAAQTRGALRWLAGIPEPRRAIYHRLGENLAEALRGDFPDVAPDVVGWITLRVGAQLGSAVRTAPDINPALLCVLAMMAGDHLVAGKR